MEFPHLLRLIDENQFDTIYHEHFSYFSLIAVEPRLRGARPAAVRRRGAAHARRLAAHLRLPRRRGRRRGGRARRRAARARGARPGCGDLETYTAFGAARGRGQARPPRVPDRGSSATASASSATARPAKGNTLLNYCGIRRRLPRLHRRPQPAQAGPLPARARSIPILAPERILRGPARLRADPAVEPARTRSSSSSRTSATGAAASRCPCRASRWWGDAGERGPLGARAGAGDRRRGLRRAALPGRPRRARLRGARGLLRVRASEGAVDWHRADLLGPGSRPPSSTRSGPPTFCTSRGRRRTARSGRRPTTCAGWAPPSSWPSRLRERAGGGRWSRGPAPSTAGATRAARESDTPLEPRTLYGASKHALHVASRHSPPRMASSSRGGDLLPLRPRREARSPGSVGGDGHAEGREAACSHGRQVRDFLHVEDAGRASVALLASDVTGPVNIASGIPTAIADVAGAIGE